MIRDVDLLLRLQAIPTADLRTLLKLPALPAAVDAELEGIAYRIKWGFRHNPRYDKQDVLDELRALRLRWEARANVP